MRTHPAQPVARLLALAAAAALCLPGCLSISYRIPKDDVRRLQQTAPALRGQRLRVVQRFASENQPPRGKGWAGHLTASNAAPRTVYGAPGGLNHGVDLYIHAGPPTWRPWVPLRPAPVSSPAIAGQPVSRGTAQAAGGEAGSAVKVPTNADTEALIVVAVATAVVVGIGLAATEGARYDGWLAVHPDHPVHVMRGGGSTSVINLSQLDSAAMGPDAEAVIYRDEGAGSWELGRAPLNRKGLFYGIGLGRVEVPVTDKDDVETAGAVIEFGWFPSHYWGLLASLSLGWDSVPGGAIVTLVQPAMELQAIPIRLWRLHLGGFAGVGSSVVEADGGPYAALLSNASLLQFGGLAQLDLTTRLALTFRYGWSSRSGQSDGHLGAMGTLGLSIY